MSQNLRRITWAVMSAFAVASVTMAADQETQSPTKKVTKQEQKQQPRAKQQSQAQKKRSPAGDQSQAAIVSVSIPVIRATPGQIAAAPSAYYGRMVSVTAEIEDVFGKQTFTLDEDRIGAGPDVLVVLPDVPRAIPEGDVVTVVGQVRPLITSEFERDYNWFDWDAREIEGDFKVAKRPVIVSASVVTENGRQLVGSR